MTQLPRLGAAQRPDTPAPDVLLRGGRVYVGRGEDGPQFADALALAGGRITAVGKESAVADGVSSDTMVLDLDGRTVVPGLIDSHLHLVRGGSTWTQEVHWFEVPTLAEALDLLDERARRVPPGSWLQVVGGWHPGQFAERRGPTSEELTRRFPNNPVYIQLLYEEAVLNAAALDACGITAETSDPPLGAFDRDPATGRPTGTVRGVGAFMHCLTRVPEPSLEDQAEGTRRLMATLNSWGVTGGIDAGGLGLPPEGYEPLFGLWRARGMTVRTRLYVGPFTRGDEERELSGWLRHTRPGFGDEWLRHIGLGEITVFGCHDLEGLTDFTVDEASRGKLETIMRDAAARRWPVHMHSVLDSTTDAVLDVWEKVAADHPIGELRWSLAHLDPVSERNLDRIAALGLGIAVQNRLVYRATASAAAWGADAVRSAPPLRSIVERGIPLGAGTDSTRVASPNPWVALWWLVTGRTLDDGPERTADQCLDRATAMDAYTVGSAWFSFEEDTRGRLAPGMAADLAVLSDDYFSVADSAIPGLRSVLTLVDGRPVFTDGPFAGLA